MYLHLGEDVVVRMSEIVGIFDMDSSTIKQSSRAFLAAAQSAGEVIDVSGELPKSFVVCTSGKKSKVYITPISSTTLLHRVETFEERNLMLPL